MNGSVRYPMNGSLEGPMYGCAFRAVTPLKEEASRLAPKS